MVSAVLDQSAPPGIVAMLAELRADAKACRLCPSMKPFRKGRTPPHGTIHTGYMLVCEAPERGADDVLLDALRAVNDQRYHSLGDLFFLANAARCRPPHAEDRERTRAPTRAECRQCRPFLQFEIRTLHPRLIIAVGAKAAEATLGRPVKIEQEHGQRHALADAEVLTLVMPTSRASLKRLGLTPDGYRRWLAGLFGALIDEL